MKNSIFNLTLNELETILLDNGFKKFNATQVFEGIYKRKVNSFDEITNISKSLKEYLNRNYTLETLKVLDKLKSADTTKYLLEVENGAVECVLMRHDYADSLCISTQIGCNMSCAFCESGRLKKVRNLNTSEIVLELLTIEKLEGIRVQNVVVMGIGEPFDNYTNLVNALNILTSPKGIDLGSRKITVSTCGVVPKIKEFASLPGQVNLAISLHAPDDELRDKIMPINKVYPIKELMSALDFYIEKTNRRVTIEYILLDGVNDTEECARGLVKLLKGKLLYVNLIPYNATSHTEFKRTSKTNQDKFYNILYEAGIQVGVRHEMGKGIKGACGQLRASYNEQN